MGPSENNRRARFYKLTRAGRKLLENREARLGAEGGNHCRFFEVKAEDLA